MPNLPYFTIERDMTCSDCCKKVPAIVSGRQMHTCPDCLKSAIALVMCTFVDERALNEVYAVMGMPLKPETFKGPMG